MKDAIPREYFGLARQFLRDLAKEDSKYDLFMTKIRGLERDNKRPRQTKLDSVIKHWQGMEDIYRFNFDVNVKYSKTEVKEIRLTIAKDKADHWAEQEYNILVTQMKLISNKKELLFESDSALSFSLHAIARRIQRDKDNCTASILRDMKSLDVKINLDEVTLKTETGCWHGKIIMIRSNGKGEYKPCACMRTWLSDEG